MNWIARTADILARRKRRDRPAPPPPAEPTEVESVSTAPDHRERLNELCHHCIEGRVAAAELELHAWMRQPDCPLPARVLFASLLARRGESEHALAVLPRIEQLADADDALAAQTLVAALVALDLKDAAASIVQQLYHDMGQAHGVIDWICLMQMPGAASLPVEPDVSTDYLGVQLVEQPRIIQTLVAAQKIEPDPAEIALLRQSAEKLVRVVHGRDQQVMFIESLATLAQLAGDVEDARRWAHHGLKISPMNATLALVLADVDDDESVGPRAADVLERVADAHPTYPDVRTALIRRHHADGDPQAARLRLADWLQADPQNPIANELISEIAA